MSTPLTTRRRQINLAGKSPVIYSPQTRRAANILSDSRSSYESPLPEVRNEEDIREKKEKRRSRTLVSSSSSPYARPPQEDIGETAKLTNDQLASHYVNCIKLSTENKITAKNAFSLHLIDHMNEMLKQRCEGVLNFQMAGGTIFASAKIYASRVDAVHSETYKVMSSLGRTSNEDKEDGEASEQGDAEDCEKKESGKRKKKRSKLLENNPSSLRLKKLEVGYQCDPLDQYYASVFDVANTSGLLTNHLHLCKDGVTVQYDSEMSSPISHNICSARRHIPTGSGDGADVIESEEEQDIEYLKTIENLYSDLAKLTETVKKASTCPPLKDFQWSQEDKSFEWDSVIKSQSTQNSVNDTLPDIDAEDDEVIMDSGSPGDDDFAFSAPSQQSKTTDSASAAPSLGLDEQLLTAFEPGEYSYFKMGAISTWEGPNHWKMKLQTKGPTSEKSASTEQTTKTRKRKRTFYIDYSTNKVQVDEREFESSKKSTVLTRRMREKWKAAETDRLLPSAGEYNPPDLAKCCLQPDVLIKPVAFIRSAQQEATEVDTDCLGIYNYDNPNDKNNYCPNLSDVEEDLDPDPQDNEIPANFVTDYSGDDNTRFPDMSQTQNNQSQMELDAMLKGDHLISHPRKVEKISIAYAKKATRIDVRRLKAAMWNVLHEHAVNASRLSNKGGNVSSMVDDESGSQGEGKTFSDLYYAGLPELVPQTMAENLSIPLAFTCLLHLANEKSLKIIAEEDMSDLNIAVPDVELEQ